MGDRSSGRVGQAGWLEGSLGEPSWAGGGQAGRAVKLAVKVSARDGTYRGWAVLTPPLRQGRRQDGRRRGSSADHCSLQSVQLLRRADESSVVTGLQVPHSQAQHRRTPARGVSFQADRFQVSRPVGSCLRRAASQPSQITIHHKHAPQPNRLGTTGAVLAARRVPRRSTESPVAIDAH